MTGTIPIAMTLKPSARNPGDIARAQRLAAELGLEPVRGGRASLSFRIPAERFEEIFGLTPERVLPQPPGPADYGTPGGYEGVDLPVPVALAAYVESVAVVPPATRLG